MEIEIDDVIVIARPADGNYTLDAELLHRLWVAVYGERYREEGSLFARVNRAIWKNIPRADYLESFTKVDGWTRPLSHIVVDLIEIANRQSMWRSRNLTEEFIGRDLAAEFMAAIYQAEVLFAHPGPETYADLDRQSADFLRVGPRPEEVRFTHEELKILNTVMSDR